MFVALVHMATCCPQGLGIKVLPSHKKSGIHKKERVACPTRSETCARAGEQLAWPHMMNMTSEDFLSVSSAKADRRLQTLMLPLPQARDICIACFGHSMRGKQEWRIIGRCSV